MGVSIPRLWHQSIPGWPWSDKKAQGCHNVPGKGFHGARGYQEHNSICGEMTWPPPPWVEAPRVARRSREGRVWVCLFWCHRQIAAGSIGAILVPAVPAQQIDRALASSTGSDTSDFPQEGTRDGHETRQSEDIAAHGPMRGTDTEGHGHQSCSKRALSAGVSIRCSEPLPHAGDAVLLMCRLESAWTTSPEKPPQKVLGEHQGESHGAAPAIRGAAAEWAGIWSKE